MAGTAAAKRKAEEAKLRSRPNKRFKKQAHYDSGSSDSEEKAMNGSRLRKNDTRGGQIKSSAKSQPVSSMRDKRRISPKPSQDAPGSIDDNSSLTDDTPSDPESEEEAGSQSGSEPDSDSDASSVSSSSGFNKKKAKTKKSDPAAFASSISAILGSKLPSRGRADPVLSRSRDAVATSHSLAESKLELKARRKMRDEKRAITDKGRVRDVLLGDRRRTPGLSESEAEEGAVEKKQKMAKQETHAGARNVATGVADKDRKGQDEEKMGQVRKASGMSAAEITEQERRLRKTAQRGVVKLFNAVRAAQANAEKAAKEQREKGVVGTKRREEKVGEMGRQAFLDMVGAGNLDAS